MGDPACDMAHGTIDPPGDGRTLVVVFASPVGAYLMHFGRDLGYRTVLVEPDPARRPAGAADQLDPSFVDGRADVVVTDHDRAELADALYRALALPARWLGLMGSPRHTPPHLAPLRARGVGESELARIHRPIGLNIGSHSPAEIAVATLAGLIADRNGRPGGFDFTVAGPR